MNDCEKIISETLKRCAIPTNLFGYDYLKDSISLVLKDRSLIHNITKGLYVKVSEMNNTSPSRVERSIRHAIEKSFQNLDKKVREEIFNSRCHKNNYNYHMTNSEYISAISEYLKYCNK